jgi:hypothetical protein
MRYKKCLLVLPFLFIFVFTICAHAQTFDWARPTGGNGVYGIAVDAHGNSYAAGNFGGSISLGPWQLTSTGNPDIFVAKYDDAGNCVWAHKAGCRWMYANSIAVDASGNSYVTGMFMDSTTFGSVVVHSYGRYDAFLAKYDANGNFKWVQHMGGQDDDDCYGAAIDAAGFVYVTGSFSQTATFGKWQLTANGYTDAYAAKYDSDGTCLWVWRGGGTGEDRGQAIGVDGLGNSYVTGNISDQASFGDTMLARNTGTAIFIAKIDRNGKFAWVKLGTGDPDNYSFGLSTDVAGVSTITGQCQWYLTFDQFQLRGGFFSTAFIARYGPSGSCIWAKSITGSLYVNSYGVAVDHAGNSFITGRYRGNAPFGSHTIISQDNGPNIYVAKYDNQGECLWVKSSGGTSIGGDWGFAIATDGNGSLRVGGNYHQGTSLGPIQLSGSGGAIIKMTDGVTDVKEEKGRTLGIPTALDLKQNYPNPFNPSTTISFSLPTKAFATLKISDVMGREVATIVSEEMSVGNYTRTWNAFGLPSGVYFCRLQAGAFTDTKRLLLIR